MVNHKNATTQSVPENFAPAPLQRTCPACHVCARHRGPDHPVCGRNGQDVSVQAPRTRSVRAGDGRLLRAPQESRPLCPAPPRGTPPPPPVRPLTAAAAGPTRVDRTDYCQSDRLPVTLYTVHGGGHSIPGPKTATPRLLMGRTDHALDTAREIGEFSASLPKSACLNKV